MSQSKNSNSNKRSKPELPAATAGYSGAPLSKKLGIKPGQRIWLIDAPDHYLEHLQPLPDDVVISKRFSPGTDPQVDMVHLFTTRQIELQKELQQLRQGLNPQVPVWVSWPKKSSGVRSSVTEDTIRQAALPLGYVDIKVCAVDSTWSALKLVVRKALR